MNFSAHSQVGCGPTGRMNALSRHAWNTSHTPPYLGPLKVLQRDSFRMFFRRLNCSLAVIGKKVLTLQHQGHRLRGSTYFTIFRKSAPEKPGVPRARTIGSTSDTTPRTERHSHVRMRQKYDPSEQLNLPTEVVTSFI